MHFHRRDFAATIHSLRSVFLSAAKLGREQPSTSASGRLPLQPRPRCTAGGRKLLHSTADPRLVREAPCPAVTVTVAHSAVCNNISWPPPESTTMPRYCGSQLVSKGQLSSIDVEIFHLTWGCYRSLFQVFRPTGNEATYVIIHHGTEILIFLSVR